MRGEHCPPRMLLVAHSGDAELNQGDEEHEIHLHAESYSVLRRPQHIELAPCTPISAASSRQLINVTLPML